MYVYSYDTTRGINRASPVSSDLDLTTHGEHVSGETGGTERVGTGCGLRLAGSGDLALFFSNMKQHL